MKLKVFLPLFILTIYHQGFSQNYKKTLDEDEIAILQEKNKLVRPIRTYLINGRKRIGSIKIIRLAKNKYCFLEVGKWQFFNKTGTLEKAGTRKIIKINSKLISVETGAWKSYYPDGQLYFEKLYNERGDYIQIIQYLQGDEKNWLSGKYDFEKKKIDGCTYRFQYSTTFHESGIIREKRLYISKRNKKGKFGKIKKYGVWKKFDENGRLIEKK